MVRKPDLKEVISSSLFLFIITHDGKNVGLSLEKNGGEGYHRYEQFNSQEGRIMDNKVLVETSARHIHLSPADLETLFGKGYELTPKKDLSQPGQFACTERLDVVGTKKTLSGVTILGPTRSATQVELSLTDARSIGVDAPIRESGDVAGTGSCRLVGPKGEIELKEGVIAAKRHIHMTPADAEAFGVENGQVVSVKVENDTRSLTFGDVVVRVSDKYALAMHIDTDESNAASVTPTTYGTVIN